jgi:hypothetical protein
MVQLSQAILKSKIKKIKWGTEKNMPFSQGWAINEVIKTYKIPAKKWGYEYDTIGVQTKKQYILWKDNGGNLEFLGLVNK